MTATTQNGPKGTDSARTYSAAVVGLGFIGAGDQVSGDALGQQVIHLDGTHAGALAGNPRVRLVAGSSRDAGRRQRFAAARGCPTFPDWRDMLHGVRPEIVSIATYAPQHAEITVAAAELGARVVYCEKPMATSVAAAQRMVDACARAGTLLVLNHNRRFSPNYRKLAALVAGCGLGQLTSANLQWGGGRLGNVGTHMIDALMMLTGRKVEAVVGVLDGAGRADCRGQAFHDPGGWGLLRLEGGLIATLDAADYAKVPTRIQVNATLGRATAGGDEVTVEYADGRQETWPSPRAQATSMDRAVAQVVAWLDAGGAFPYPADEALRTLEAIAGLHVAHDRRGAWVELPLAPEHRGRELGCA